MRRIAHRILVQIIMVLSLCLLTPDAVFAQTAEPQTAEIQTHETQTIQVGYYEDGDYMSLNQQGEYVGYNIEFLQEIAKQSGLRFEIVDAGSWNAAYHMLVDGEIDLLPSVYFSEERLNEILFVTQPMCSIYTTLNVRMDDERYDYEDFKAFEGMKVGIIKGGIDGVRFREFCAEHQITLDIIDYEETGELLSALDQGVLDGVAITHLGKNSSYRSVAQFSPSPLYFAVTKKNPGLLDDLNRAMNSILLNNPGYSTDLYDKYLSPSTNQKPVFTRDERQYMAQAGPVVVSYDPGFAPLSYQDKNSGEFRGVVSDIFHFIESNSELFFVYEAHPQSEALELLSQGKVDALCVSDGDYLWDGRNHINSTLYYLSSPTSLITRNNSAVQEVLALPKGYQLSEEVAKDFPNSVIHYFSSIRECLDAVHQGKADAAYLNTQTAGSFLDDIYYNDMNETTLSRYTNKLCIGVSSNADPRLYSILNKCIQYLPAEQVDAFMIKNSADAKDISLAEFVEQHTWPVMGGVSLILGIIILLVSYNLRNALRSNRRIQELLYKDELTGLDSMNGFYGKWSALTSNKKQHGLALLYGDIRQFKLINDTFGFAMGDKVLLTCARVLSEALGPKECCGRISADNFVLLLQYQSWEQLTLRLTACVDKLDQWRKEETEIPNRIHVVFGVYLTGQAEDPDIHQMMDLANYARRHAKNTPGSFAVLYDEQMRRAAVVAGQLESSLDQALSCNEFEVYYQPKVSIRDAQVIGSEALIRWNHPEKGFLMPGTFIPLFEKNGMVKKVDFWLFETVCRTIQSWKQQGIRLLPVSCNFSRLHFIEPDFPEQVCRIADRYGIPKNLLEIEITESALLEDSDTIVSMLPRLKELGFLISIDDFGSGYSSLGQLQQLTADILKLDRSFVCHGVAGIREQIVLRNLIQMAGELGMTVICEGVENRTQSQLLQAMGCRFAQGFYFHRPMPQADYEELLS